MMSFTVLGQPTGTQIAWAHHTLNFWWGCNEVSKECSSCYVKEDMNNKRLNFHAVRATSPEQWMKALKLNDHAAAQGKCALVFTCSYSDFFHQMADVWRPKAWQIIGQCPNLVWLILTKRPELIPDCLPPDWGEGYPNVWLGTTVGVLDSYPRLDYLRKIKCQRRFISVEPLMESVADMDISSYSWLLVGGMSGPSWEVDKMNVRWAAEVRELALQHPGTALFFNQCSAARSERGIDGLGRYLEMTEAGKPALFRAIPTTTLPMLPLSVEKGHRFSEEEWEAYLSDANENSAEVTKNSHK